METIKKPLGGKCYGSIPHLPGSRMGPGDHHCHAGQAQICTEKVRDKHDRIYVQDKLDGSCCGVLRQGNEIIPLTRAGYLANTSKYEQHHLFWDWAHENKTRFLDLLEDEERVVGEWLAQAHSIRYCINPLFEVFAAFDIIRGKERATFDEVTERICYMDKPFCTPRLLGRGPMSITQAISEAEKTKIFRIDPAEGIVYRVERKGKVDFLAKYVRPDKKDGIYLPEVSGKEAVWNWRPPIVQIVKEW